MYAKVFDPTSFARKDFYSLEVETPDNASTTLTTASDNSSCTASHSQAADRRHHAPASTGLKAGAHSGRHRSASLSLDSSLSKAASHPQDTSKLPTAPDSASLQTASSSADAEGPSTAPVSPDSVHVQTASRLQDPDRVSAASPSPRNTQFQPVSHGQNSDKLSNDTGSPGSEDLSAVSRSHPQDAERLLTASISPGSVSPQAVSHVQDSDRLLNASVCPASVSPPTQTPSQAAQTLMVPASHETGSVERDDTHQAASLAQHTDTASRVPVVISPSPHDIQVFPASHSQQPDQPGADHLSVSSATADTASMDSKRVATSARRSFVTQGGEVVRHVIVDCSTMTYIDLSGVDMLHVLITQFSRAGVAILLTGIPPTTLAILTRAGFFSHHGYHNVFFSVEDALHAVRNERLPKGITRKSFA